VVGSNGNLTGFAGGLDKKRRMLEEEGVRLVSESRADVSNIHLFDPPARSEESLFG
jgi:hypothetical protein